MIAKGNGLDERDLKEKYKGKDDAVVANILKNALSIKCPVTNRKLYMDPEYEMATQYEEDQEYCRSILFES